VVAGPEEAAEVRRGVVLVDGGRPWVEDARRAAVAGRLSVPRSTAGPGELLVLPDRREPGDADDWRIGRGAVKGRVSWVLLPGDQQLYRMGEAVR
jgi:hypothetical protein